jgi:DNA-binding MarR family transcriptional regulator
LPPAGEIVQNVTEFDDLASDSQELNPSELLFVPGASTADMLNLRLGFLIHDVSRLRRNVFDQLMRPLGVTRSQWWVLAHLSRKDGMMQTELAALLDVGKVTLGGLVDRLEAGGWVERRAHPEDRRVKHVFLTPQAHRLLQQMQSVEQRHNRSILKGFSQADRKLLIELLTRAKHNLLPG